MYNKKKIIKLKSLFFLQTLLILKETLSEIYGKLDNFLIFYNFS